MSILIAIAAAVAVIALGVVAIFIGFRRRFLGRLRAHPAFTPRVPPTWDGVFEYASSDTAELSEFRETYDLSSIAGSGTELERIVRLMTWVHGLTRHARNPSVPDDMSGLNLARLALEGKRINCWMYATILSDALASLGFASRILHLWPYPEKPGESHLVTAVYSTTYAKWLMIDPDMCAYLMDEAGTPLGADEVRERLVRGRPLHVADSVHLAGVSWIGRPLLKRLYLWYLSKNLFRFDCPGVSVPGYESRRSGRTYVQLLPDGYHDELLAEPRVTERGNSIFYIRDPEIFWQPPKAGPDARSSASPV